MIAGETSAWKKETDKMNDRVLFVDDEANVLSSIKRQLRKKFSVYTALSGAEALELIAQKGPFAAVVVDMRMPDMNGIEVLSRIKKIAPETVRMMLTGYADQETAIQAVNEGNIFRFLNKPCSPELLENAVRAAIEQYRLVTAERELLDQTLKGSIKVMTEILSQVSPSAFSRAYRIKDYVSQVVNELHLPRKWEFSIAAYLSQLGCVTVPNDILDKVYSGIPLKEDEEKIFNSHPMVGARLLANIPRLGNVAAMIELQMKRFDQYSGKPATTEEQLVWIGAHILKAVIDYDQLLFMGFTREKALSEMKRREGWYNPKILNILQKIKSKRHGATVKKVNLNQLCLGMVLAEDVLAKNGLLLASRGQTITYSVKERLLNFSKTIGVKEPISVLVN